MKREPSIDTIRRRFASADFSTGGASETPLDPCLPLDDTESVAIPQRIEALIAQRQAMHDKVFRQIPLPGQIVRVPPRPDDSGNACSEYLAVLLDAEIAIGKWRGWLVGRDSNYAGSWDLVLGPEDEPRDPMCQLVQIWNPVALSIQEADRVLAELTPERLAAARAIARDHAQNVIPSPIDDHRMGVHLARELSDGTGVVTGTSSAAQNDPRTEYQRLYRDAALLISSGPLPASSASTMSKQEAGSRLQRWLKATFDFRGGNWLKPAAAFVTLLLVPLLIVQVMRDNPEQIPGVNNVYISGGGTQEMRAEHPATKAKEIEDRLRAAGATPEIRYESGGTIAILADLAVLTDDNRKQFLAVYGLTAPADMELRLLIVPAEKGTERTRP